MWWNKPLDIQEPEQIMIKTLELSAYIARMCRGSHFEDTLARPDESELGYTTAWNQLTLPVSYRMSSSQGQIGTSRGIRGFFSTDHRVLLQIDVDIRPDVIRRTSESPDDTVNTELTRTVPDEMEKFFLERPSNGITIKCPHLAPDQLPESPSIDLSHGDIQRWKLAASASLDLAFPGISLATRIRNFPVVTFRLEQWPLYVGLGLTGFVYGGLHCLAWNAPFPSSAESLLWRLSSVSITSTGALVALVISWHASPPFWSSSPRRGSSSWAISVVRPTLLLMDFLDKVYDAFPLNLSIIQRLHDRLRVPRFLDIVLLTVHFIISIISCVLYVFFMLTSPLLKPVFDIAIVLLIILYAVARVYLVVECFINLGHLPPLAYELPQWSRYVPHIG